MKVSLTFVALLFSICLFAQDLSGTWEGIFGTRNIIPGRKSPILHLEIKQEGRKLTGLFYFVSPETSQMGKLYEISGDLGRKHIFPFRLVSGESLVNYYNYNYYITILFSTLENIRYIKDATTQILYGRWLSNEIVQINPGGFAVKKVSDTYALLDKYNNKNP